MAAFPDASLSMLVASIIFFFVAAGVVLVLWIAMPFSLFGLKTSLKAVTEEQEETNRLLRSILNTLMEKDDRERRLSGARDAGLPGPKEHEIFKKVEEEGVE